MQRLWRRRMAEVFFLSSVAEQLVLQKMPSFRVQRRLDEYLMRFRFVWEKRQLEWRFGFVEKVQKRCVNRERSQAY